MKNRFVATAALGIGLALSSTTEGAAPSPINDLSSCMRDNIAANNNGDRVLFLTPDLALVLNESRSRIALNVFTEHSYIVIRDTDTDGVVDTVEERDKVEVSVKDIADEDITLGNQAVFDDAIRHAREMCSKMGANIALYSLHQQRAGMSIIGKRLKSSMDVPHTFR